jgi:hypothetical protein
MPRRPRVPARTTGAASALRIAACAAAIAVFASVAIGAPAAATPRATGARAAVEEGVRWSKLKPAQREALKPLQQDWSTIEATRKQKWLQIADRMPNMPPDERLRVQARMTEWARLTPQQRGEARLRYEEARQLPAADRRSRWDAYQALSPEEKRELAARATARNPAPPARPTTARPDGAPRAVSEFSHGKSNIVPNPAFAAPLRPVAPTVVQAAPGATTTLITRRPAPPPHQQTGVPKVAATPEFVNRTTLLPKRGPQGAAIRTVPPVDGGSAPHH